MRQRSSSSAAHRPGSLKANNKAHKTGRHKSQRSLKRIANGKVGKRRQQLQQQQQQRKKAPKQLSKADKKNRLKLMRIAKQQQQQQQQQQQKSTEPEVVVDEKVDEESSTTTTTTTTTTTAAPESTPLVVTMISLAASVSHEFLVSLVRSSEPDGRWQRVGRRRLLLLDGGGHKRRLRFEFASATGGGGGGGGWGGLWSCLDAAKAADILLLVFDRGCELEQFEHSLAALYAQGLPQQTHLLMLASSDCLKEKKLWEKVLSEELRQRFSLPGNDRVAAVQSAEDLRRLLRRLTSRSKTKTAFAEARSHGLLDSVAPVDAGVVVGDVSATTWLRGGLSCGHLVHVVGCGDFRVLEARRLQPGDGDGDDVCGDVEMATTEEEVKEGKDDDVDDAAMEAEAAEEAATRSKESREQSEFPDELDTPQDTPARARFSAYRPAASLRAFDVGKFDDLPEEYSQLAYFSNFQHARNRVAKSTKAEACELANCRAQLRLQPLTQEAAVALLTACRQPDSLAVWCRLLEHEERLTMVNACVRAPADVLRSKRHVVWQVGWRRYKAQPIFSEHSAGDKHLYLRQLPANQHAVASFYAPLTYTPATVLGLGASGQLLLTGSVLNCDPGRIVVKRTILSGQPFKVHKRSAVVRYLFFNPEDVLHFREASASLRTKRGRRGQILEPVGTHGLMKCRFDGPVTNMDTVLMDLFRRQFPKLNYSPVC